MWYAEYRYCKKQTASTAEQVKPFQQNFVSQPDGPRIDTNQPSYGSKRENKPIKVNLLALKFGACIVALIIGFFAGRTIFNSTYKPAKTINELSSVLLSYLGNQRRWYAVCLGME